MGNSHLRSGGRYPVLRSIAIIYLYLGIAFALAGLAFAVYALVTGWSNPILPFGRGWGGRLASCAVILSSTALLVLSMLAVAEVLKLFIDIEHNSRMSASANMGATAASPESAKLSPDNGGVATRTNRITLLEGEETAEGALLRGH